VRYEGLRIKKWLSPKQVVVAYRVEMLRIPHCLGNQCTDDGKAESLTHRPRSTPQKRFHFCLWYSFPLEAEHIPGPSAARRIR
jgi:hypothetical protein